MTRFTHMESCLISVFSMSGLYLEAWIAFWNWFKKSSGSQTCFFLLRFLGSILLHLMTDCFFSLPLAVLCRHGCHPSLQVQSAWCCNSQKQKNGVMAIYLYHKLYCKKQEQTLKHMLTHMFVFWFVNSHQTMCKFFDTNA